MVEPPSLEKLISEFECLPGIGHKTARRLAYHILSRPRERVAAFSESLLAAADNVKTCSLCHVDTESDPCHMVFARRSESRLRCGKIFRHPSF